jgi:hypothetical protein
MVAICPLSQMKPESGRDQAPPFFASTRKDFPAGQFQREKNVDKTHRKPLFSFRLFGLFLLR